MPSASGVSPPVVSWSSRLRATSMLEVGERAPPRRLPRNPTSATRSRRWYASPSSPSTVPEAAAARSGAPMEPLRSTHTTTVRVRANSNGRAKVVERRARASGPARLLAATRWTARSVAPRRFRLARGRVTDGPSAEDDPVAGAGVGGRRGAPAISGCSLTRAGGCRRRIVAARCRVVEGRLQRPLEFIRRKYRRIEGPSSTPVREHERRDSPEVLDIVLSLPRAPRRRMPPGSARGRRRKPSAPTCNASRDAASSTSSASDRASFRAVRRELEMRRPPKVAGLHRIRAGDEPTPPDLRPSSAHVLRRRARSGRAAAAAARPPRGSSSRRARSGPDGGATRRRARRRFTPETATSSSTSTRWSASRLISST